jgi:HEPN domain-containing protein
MSLLCVEPLNKALQFMGMAKSRYLASRWLVTAEEDLAAARKLYQHDMYAVSPCFHSRRAGEKGVNAIWFFEDEDPWGHSVEKLIDDFPRKSDLPDLFYLQDNAALLHKYYNTTRCPNGLPDLTPGQTYTRVMLPRDWRRLHCSLRFVSPGWKPHWESQNKIDHSSIIQSPCTRTNASGISPSRWVRIRGSRMRPKKCLYCPPVRS